MKVKAKDVPTADDNATESASEKLESLIVRWLGGRVWLKNSRSVWLSIEDRHFVFIASFVRQHKLEWGNGFRTTE